MLPVHVKLVVSMHPPPPPLLSFPRFFFSPSRNMPPFKEYQQLGRTKRWERMAELQTAVTEILGPTWQVQAGENVGTLILKTTEGPMPKNHMWHAEALLWDCRKEGKSWRALQYSIPTSRIKCPLDEIRRVKEDLSAPPVVDYNAMDGDHALLGAGTNLREKLGLMMAARKGNLYPDLWVRLCVDGTQLHKRHFEHFMLGVLGSGNPLGSWCILHGSEKRAVLRSLTRVSKMDEQVQEALNTRYEVQGGYMEKPHIFLVADVVAQQAMAGIKRWNCTSEDPVCWVCGKCRAHCDRDFGKGLSPILSHWTWYGQVLRSIVPKYRPPDYALHGVTRVTHSGLDGCWRALVQHHRFTKRRAITWVQTHVNPCRVASHSVAPQDIAGQACDKPSLRCEQSAAILFVSTKAWGPLIVGLNNEGLLQHVVEGGHTWAQNFDSWWDCFHKSAIIAKKEGLLGAQVVEALKNVLPQMAVHHKRCQLGQTLWVHLWVDHMLGYAKQWHALGAFAAFKAEERHKTLKTEIRFRSFKGGARKVKGGVRGQRGRLVRQVFVKGWREAVKNDNLDWGLLKRGWDVWVRAWTQQAHVREHKTYWKANAP